MQQDIIQHCRKDTAISSLIIEITEFAKRQFEPDFAGTRITNRTPEQFQEHLRTLQPRLTREGDYPFSRLFFFNNYTYAHAGTMPITRKYLRSEYRSRQEGELPVLERWLEVEAPTAIYLCLVCYTKEQLATEGTIISASWGIVAILGQMTTEAEPMKPITMMRNALGIAEGGNGEPIDREKYLAAVEFWSRHATVKELT